MRGRTVPSTRPHQKRGPLPRRHLRHQMPPRRHRQGHQRRLQQGRTARLQRGHPPSKPLLNLHHLGPSATPSIGCVEGAAKSMDCTVMVATRAVHPSTRRGISTNMPHIGYAPTVKTKYLSKGACVDVESGGRGAHRSSTTGKLLRTASWPRVQRQPQLS